MFHSLELLHLAVETNCKVWAGRLKSERSKCKGEWENTAGRAAESVPLINGALFGCKLCAREHLPARNMI